MRATTKRRKNGTRCPTFGARRNGSRYKTKCDHDPAKPRLQMVRPIKRGMPPIIYKLIDRCQRIYTHPHEFAEYSFKWLSKARRSQRREAIVLVNQALFYRMDIASRRVGQPIPGTPYLMGLPVEQIAAWTGLSLSRTRRALWDMARATYQSTSLDKRGRRCPPQPRELKEDPEHPGQRVYRSRPAVRKFEDLIFHRLHLTIEMDAASKKASEKRKAQATTDLNAAAAVARQERAALYATREARILQQREDAAATAAARRAEDAAARARLAVLLLEVRREHSDWTAAAQREEAERRHIAAEQSTGPPE